MTNEKLSSEFRDGAKAIFDIIMCRVANNYHPNCQSECDNENKLVTEWISDALEEVSPEDHFEWISIINSRQEGYNEGFINGVKYIESKIPKTIIGKLILVFTYKNK